MSGNQILLVEFSVNFNSSRSFSIRSANGFISFGLDVNISLVWLSISKIDLYAGFFGFELSFIAYCRDSCFRLKWRGGS